MNKFDKIYKVILQSITDDDYDKFYERVDAAEELIDSIIAKYVNDQKMMEKFVYSGMDIDYDENCRSDKTGIACLIIDGAIEEMLDHPSEFFIEGRKDKDYLEIEAYTNDFGEEMPDMFGKVWGHQNLTDQYQDGGLDFNDVKRRVDRIGLGPVVDKWFAELGPQDDEQDQDDIDINSVNKKVSKKQVIKEDNNWQRNQMGKKQYYSQDDQDEQDYEDVDYDECFDTVQMTILENEGLKDKLRGALNKFFENPDEYIWENIFEGDGFAWLGLKDPRTWDKLGFKVGKTNFDILTKWTEAVDSGAFGDWDEYCDENAQEVFKNVGWGDLVELANKGWSDEDDGQYAESVKPSKKTVIKEQGEGFVATREQVEEEISTILSDYDWEISLNCNMERLGKRISRKFIKEYGLNFENFEDFHDTAYEAVYEFVYNQ